MERLDIHKSKEIFEYYLKRLETCSMSDRQKNLIKKFVHEAQLGKNSSKRVGIRRLTANLQSFFRLHEYFKKDFDKLTGKEIEIFFQDLDTNRIKQNNGSPYKNSTKDELIRNLKRYLKTLWSKEVYDNRARWMKEYDEIPEIPAITIDQLKAIAEECKFRRDKALIMFLGDSGCRIEEALNLRIRDIEKKDIKNGESFYIINVEGTKTAEAKRRISIPLASPYMTKWLSEHPAILDREAFLFPISYDAVRKFLRISSKKALSQTVTPHQLRHSSATYYCQKINNPYKFVYRYGWKINSEQARRYIDRSKLGEEAQEELSNIIKVSRVAELEEEVIALKQQLRDVQAFLKLSKRGLISAKQSLDSIGQISS